MVRLDGSPTAWLKHLTDEDRWGFAECRTGVEDDFEWLDEPSDQDETDGPATSDLFDPIDPIDPQWLARWEEFEELLGDGEQADEG